MESLIFKGKNKTTIEVSFKINNNLLHQPVLKFSKGHTKIIPLLLDLTQAISANRKLLDLNRKKEYDFDYLRNIVAGACCMSMKRAF